MYGVDFRTGARRRRALVARPPSGWRLLATVLFGSILLAGLVPGVARATAPVVTTDTGSASFVAGDNTSSTPVVVDAGLTVTGSGLTSGTVSITNFRFEDRLAFENDGSTMGNVAAAYNSATGVLTLTAAGGVTPVQFQAALRAVTYTDIAVTPDTTTRALSFAVTDGSGTSTPATRTVTVADTNQTPIVTATGSTTNYSLVGGGSAVTIDSGVTVGDLDNATQSSATVSITSGFQSGDMLAFANTSAALYGNIADSDSSNTGNVLILTSSGTPATNAQWANALSAVAFSAVAVGNRTISFVTNDGTTDSAAATDTVHVTAAPGAPTGVSATAGDGEATVSWSAPSSDGGAPITSYTVTASPGGATASGTASPIAVTGLSDGTSYTFTVVATNSVGTSGSSTASTAVTPAAPPGAPTGVSAVAGDGQATVSFTAPSSNGSAITSYRVTASPGGATATASAGPITVTGLTNGTAYTFTVTATNGVGTGSASAASNTVTPAPAASPSPVPTPTPAPAPAPAPDTGAPSPPAGLAGSFTGGVLRLSWQVASDNVGVDHYELYLDNAPLERIAGSQTQASIRTFEPTGSSVYTVRAFDAAGNQSAVITSVTIVRTKRPKDGPRRIPRWSWQLLAWQQHDRHGARPKTPAKLPAWYSAWKTWREHPFQLTA
jgi:hypothetical protein